MVFVRKDNIRAAKELLESRFEAPPAQLYELLGNITRAKCCIPSLISRFSAKAEVAPTVKDMLIALSALHYIHTVPEQFHQPSALAQELSELLPEDVRKEFIERNARLPVPQDFAERFQHIFQSVAYGLSDHEEKFTPPNMEIDGEDLRVLSIAAFGLPHTLNVVNVIDQECMVSQRALEHLHATMLGAHQLAGAIMSGHEQCEKEKPATTLERRIAEDIAFKLDRLMQVLMTDRDGGRVPEEVFVQKLGVISIPSIPDKALQAIAGAYRKVYYGTKDSAEKMHNFSVLMDFVCEMLEENRKITAEELAAASGDLKQEKQQQRPEAHGLYETAIKTMNALSDILVGKAVGSLERK